MLNSVNGISISSTDILKGAVSSMAVAGIVNYNKVKKEQISQDKALKNTLKLGIQGGIATGAALSATNYYASKNYIGLFSALSIGAAGIYMVEKINDKFEEKETKEVETIKE